MMALPGDSTRSLNRGLQMRDAVLRTFCAQMADALPRLGVTHQEWKRLLPWLHTSGLALYLLDRLHTLRLSGLLPAEIREGLEENLADNTRRAFFFFEEASEINRLFQDHGLIFANLKGITLWPISVPKPELRSQLDLDFLIHPHHVNDACHLLERRGYRLHTISGNTWELKAQEGKPPTMRELYKPSLYRSLELHVEPADSPRLERLTMRQIHGVAMPVLGAEDLYLHQALHLFKHIRSEFTRLSWLLELRQHTISRFNDMEFQREMSALCETDPTAGTALAVALQTTSHLTDDFVPEAMYQQMQKQLSPEVKLWVERYSQPALLADFPGSKLYLLLAGALEDGLGMESSSRRRSLMPRRLPPRIALTPTDDTLPERLQRYGKQIAFIAFRTRFHIVEGLRYAAASARWRQWMTEQSR